MAEIEIILAVGGLLSGIGAVVTASIIYFKMKESNKITREALQETKRINKFELIKNKPKLLIEAASYEIQDNFIWLKADLVNSGMTSANNVRFAFIAKNHFFGEEIFSQMLENKTLNLFDNHLGSVSNDQSITINPSAQFPFKTEIVCMALWFQYDFFDEKDNEEIHILVFERGVSPHNQFTIENTRVKELRKK